MENKITRKSTMLWAKLTLAATLVAGPLVSALPAQAASASGDGQPKVLNKANTEAFLDEFFSNEAYKPYYKGASVVIVKDGKVVIEKGYGYADEAAKTPVVSDKTVFRMASVSKTFTATAVMQLVEQGKVKLDEDFTAYTGPLSFDNPFGSPVTVGQLLTHTTGFRIQNSLPTDFNNPNRVSLEDYVKAHMPPVIREPGTSYMYDNFAYLLAGLVVEKASGEPFEDYMQKHIFAPLGMESSSFLLEGKLEDALASGYNTAGEPVEFYTVNPKVWPTGGMFATADDIGKYMLALLDGGSLNNKRILSEATVKEMEKYRSSIHPLLPDTTYGFEAAISAPGAGSNPAIITKAGDLLDSSSYMVMIPEENVGLFLVSNQQFPLREILYPAFMKEFYPQYAKAADLGTYPPAAEASLDRYTGYYVDLRLKTLVSRVSVEEGQLTITDALVGPRPLSQVAEGLFTDALTGKFTAFKLNPDGKPVYFKEPYLNYLGYGQKAVEPAGYTDVPADHPYAEPIRMLQSLGYLSNEGGQAFHPEQVMTRSAFVRQVLETLEVPASSRDNLTFNDVQGHPDEGYVQAALELGMIKGTGKGQFHPDRGITRQEAASMIWSFYKLKYPDELFKDVKLSGATDKWAVPAVKMMVALGVHGPEVQKGTDGATDYLSKQPLTKQEAASILYALFLQPMDQIVAKLAQP